MSTAFDQYGRAAAREDALGNRWTTLFDAYGRRSGEQDPLGYRTTIGFDVLDRSVERQRALGYVQTTVFDALSRVRAAVDPLGRRTTTIFDPPGRPEATVNPLGYPTTAVYDLRGSAIARIDPRGYRTSHYFDALAREIAEEDALARRTTQSYDARGLATVRMDARGWAVTATFDALQRTVEKLYRDGVRVTFLHDPVGQLVAAQEPAGNWTNSYDAVGRLQTEAGPTHPNGQPLTHLWDADGNRVELVGWFGRVTSTYDGRRAMIALVDPLADRSTWTFDAAGRNIEQVLSDGSVATLSYDADSRLVGTRHRDQAGATLDLALLEYDAAGNPVLKVTQDGRHTMAYDALNQLLGENHPLSGAKTWTYDPTRNRLSQDHTQVGARTLTNWVYDPADQLQTETTGNAVTTFSFDRAGNQEVVQGPAEVTTNVWDSDNRLLRIQLPTGARNTMAYRPDGLRSRLQDSEGDKRMIWDSQGSSGYQDLLQERLE